jgi:hypothetical protein
MSERILLVNIPDGNGYAENLKMLSRVQQHLDELKVIESAKMSGFTNPFTVNVVPPEKMGIVGAVLESHYGFTSSIQEQDVQDSSK